MSNYPDIDSLARAHGTPASQGVIRAQPEDFKVFEIPAFDPSGDGEHVLLTIRKINLNTADIAQAIARLTNLPLSKISWAGLKDRNAVTEQRFSVHLANQPEPDWTQLNTDQVQVLDVQRHQRKLKRGVLKGNRFEIRVTAIEGSIEEFTKRYEKIRMHGVPNYFGEQRFGRHGGNLEKALAMFQNPKKKVKKHLRGIFISAARAYLFNAVLDQRVQSDSWNQILPGEICMLNNSHSIFLADEDPTLEQRLHDFDIHPTGPMWGEGELLSQDECRDLEYSIVKQYPDLVQGLEKARLKQERRALRLIPENMLLQASDDDMLLSFELPPGTYATSVLRELINEYRLTH